MQHGVGPLAGALGPAQRSLTRGWQAVLETKSLLLLAKENSGSLFQTRTCSQCLRGLTASSPPSVVSKGTPKNHEDSHEYLFQKLEEMKAEVWKVPEQAE